MTCVSAAERERESERASERERERERESQEDKGNVLMIKGRPIGKQKIQSLSQQLKSNQIQQQTKILINL